MIIIQKETHLLSFSFAAAKRRSAFLPIHDHLQSV